MDKIAKDIPRQHTISKSHTNTFMRQKEKERVFKCNWRLSNGNATSDKVASYYKLKNNRNKNVKFQNYTVINIIFYHRNSFVA